MGSKFEPSLLLSVFEKSYAGTGGLGEPHGGDMGISWGLDRGLAAEKGDQKNASEDERKAAKRADGWTLAQKEDAE